MSSRAHSETWLDQAVAAARATGDRGAELRRTRNKALLLLGFCRGFRSDELTRLPVEHMEGLRAVSRRR